MPINYKRKSKIKYMHKHTRNRKKATQMKKKHEWSFVIKHKIPHTHKILNTLMSSTLGHKKYFKCVSDQLLHRHHSPSCIFAAVIKHWPIATWGEEVTGLH